MRTILLSDSIKARLLTMIDADIAEDNGEFTLEDRAKVEAVPVGTRCPLELDDEREDHLAFHPEDMTGDELVAYAWWANLG